MEEDVNNVEESAAETLPTIQETVSIMSAAPLQEYNTPMPLSSANNFQVIKDTVESLDAMNQLAAVLVTSGLCPLKKPADVVIAIITGNQYGFHFMTSVNHIFAVNGKPTLSAHLQRALLLQHGIVDEKIADFEPVYDWARTNPDGSVIMIDTPQGKKPSIIKRGTTAEKPNESCRPSNEVDRVTTYRFTRELKQPNGSYKTKVVIASFSMSDAAKADLLDKDNWKKYPNFMLDARAYTKGAREIASDVTLGIQSLNELADSANIKYTINASLEENILQ